MRKSQRGITKLHLSPNGWMSGPGVMTCGARMPLPEGESYVMAFGRATCQECKARRQKHRDEARAKTVAS
jgi:hypothetical protein